MKLRIMEEFNKVSKVFINHYDDYNLIHHSKVDQDNMFIVVEKFFFRNSSRASLSIVLTNKESYCEATIIGSGGGQGIAFKRLDSNNDQTVGQIRFSNNATDNLAYIRCITDGDTTSSRLEFHTNTGSGTAANLVIKKNGNVAINYGLGGGAINSKFNVFADGEALRLDGTANTSRTLRFRNAAVNGSGNAIITSDGILQIKTEDANAHIYVNSVRDIAMQVTSLNGTAGHFTFSSYNTEIMRIDGANNRVGIGTGANPNLKLHVEENADTWVGEFKNVRGAGGYGLRVDMSAGSATDTRYALGVYTPGNSGLFVRNNGNVGIGTSNPGAGLELNLASGDGLLINSADIATIKMKATGGAVANWGFATTNLAAGDFGI